jgi:hypothetical protein
VRCGFWTDADLEWYLGGIKCVPERNVLLI